MAYPEGLPANQALDALVSNVKLTEYEAGTYESTGTRRFDKIVRFGTVDCVKAEWLVKHKGVWTITDTGRAAFHSFTDPEAFYKEAVRLYRKWRLSQPASPKVAEPDSPDDSDPEKSARITFEQAEEQAWQEIEQFLGGMNPYEFQELVADLLRAMGYFPSWIAPPGKDGGVDIIAYSDPLGTRAPRIKVQVKRFISQRVDSDGLKAFMANLGDDDVGLFVTLSGFTRDASDFARTQERRKITLIDLEKLVDLWIQFYGKLDDRARQRFALTPIYFVTPST
jgi:restriction system protein